MNIIKTAYLGEVVGILGFLEDLYGRIRSLLQAGFSEDAIIKKLDTCKDRWAKCLTLGSICFANMIRSAINSAP